MPLSAELSHRSPFSTFERNSSVAVRTFVVSAPPSFISGTLHLVKLIWTHKNDYSLSTPSSSSTSLSSVLVNVTALAVLESAVLQHLFFRNWLISWNSMSSSLFCTARCWNSGIPFLSTLNSNPLYVYLICLSIHYCRLLGVLPLWLSE